MTLESKIKQLHNLGYYDWEIAQELDITEREVVAVLRPYD